ncbi:hypothetical protein PLICRDRAFT_48029 [Plicaturopsis crispa FD-325 SS-3]|nr:hypothetical protein PLICRDRAFT_48029 [Plicaturopsis crispa FD-325 SS-3]
MVKRAATPSTSDAPAAKKARSGSTFAPIKISTEAAANAVQADRPLPKLLKAVEDAIQKPAKGDCVVYWMRMGDLRVSNNRALYEASQQARKDEIPLIVVKVLSPQDWVAHDRSARRIDFVLRNLASVKDTLEVLNIPLHTVTHTPRRTLPSRVLSLLRLLNATRLYANIEYEVDELRRDIKFCELAKAVNIKPHFFHNKCIVDPGVCRTLQDKPYAVYSPYQRTWLSKLNGNLPYYLNIYPSPSANDDGVRTHAIYGALFDTPVPASVEGFELDEDEKNRMREIWPAGEETAKQLLDRFIHTKSRTSQLGAVDPLSTDAEKCDKKSRVLDYDKSRDKASRDTTSRLSPYLSAGVISPRDCVVATMRLLNIPHVEAGRTSGVGVWVQELAWRDFYTEILIEFPRVSMGRPYQEKYSNVKWEVDDANLEAWKEGKTGVPIVDAAMRQLKTMGWMHNRMRMIAAMFLTKDLMIDWRLGERHFMEQLIDGDLASNNGGWQWSSSTGVDACPYFRIFNPYSQSEKTDPTGEFIRYYVPELANLRGPDLHHPSEKVADKVGYPRPIVKHEFARDRALRRYKEPGCA